MFWEYNDRSNDKNNSDVISDAIKNLRYRQTQLLVENGSQVNSRDSYMRTPLIMISIYLTGFDNWYNRERFAKLLLQHNANPNLSDSFGLTPLIHAAINGQSDYVKVLLSNKNTDYQMCDKAGNNALMLASRYGQIQVLRALYDHIISDSRVWPQLLDHKNHDNKTALDLAIEGNHYECVSLLNSLSDLLKSRREVVPQMARHPAISKASNCDTLKTNNSFVTKLSQNDKSMLKSQSKSHENLLNGKTIITNGLKLPPINGKRFVEYKDWNQQNTNDCDDRKTI